MDDVGSLAALIAATELWIKDDPGWARFQQSCGRGWNIRLRVMDDSHDEAIDWRNKIMWLAMWRWPDPKTRTAHLIGHIMEHYGAEMFTEAMCRQADEFAAFQMAMSTSILAA